MRVRFYIVSRGNAMQILFKLMKSRPHRQEMYIFFPASIYKQLVIVNNMDNKIYNAYLLFKNTGTFKFTFFISLRSQHIFFQI